MLDGAREWRRGRRGRRALSRAVLKTHCWKPSVNSWLLFLDLLCLPVLPYNIMHLVYRFFGALSLRDPKSPPGLKFEWSCNIKAPQVWAEGAMHRARQEDKGLGAFETWNDTSTKSFFIYFSALPCVVSSGWDMVCDCLPKQIASFEPKGEFYVLTSNLNSFRQL